VASRTEKINDILRSIRTSSPETIGAALVSTEGFIVSSILPNEVDEELVAGMAAALLGVGERISSDLMRAEMEQTYIRSPKGYIIINSVSEDAVIVLLVTREAKLGLIFLELKRLVEELSRVI